MPQKGSVSSRCQCRHGINKTENRYCPSSSPVRLNSAPKSSKKSQIRAGDRIMVENT